MAIRTQGTLIAGALAALGASACCAGPLILVMLGIGGGWASHLMALAPYSPFLTGLTLLSLGAAFYNLYCRPATCAPAQVCARPTARRNQQFVFWAVAVPAILLVTFPLFARLFY